MTPLGKELIRLIQQEGPINIERYMAIVLGDPRYGYYMTRDPFGTQGDFTTAPEISQMFGELLGLWCADLWIRMDRPTHLSLVELGPGRGTLMQDALRAMQRIKGLYEAISITLVEISPALRQAQNQTLATFGLPVAWQSEITILPQKPTIIIANEFFDALPVRQFQRAKGKWHERLIGLDHENALIFGLAGEAEGYTLPNAPEGTILERCPIGERLMAEISHHIALFGGAGLAIDYGHTQSGFGETLQALKSHAFVDPLSDPGDADLTTHVDFERLAASARSQGVLISGPVTQADFLEALGIKERALQLKKNAAPDQAMSIDVGLNRLTDRSPKGMGSLFKVLGFRHAECPLPAGFV